MLKTKQLTEQVQSGVQENRSTLAEIRRTCLMRQPICNGGYPPGRKAVNTKPGYYDNVQNTSRHKTYNKFTIEKPSLPYYVVPVLYVPQKVLSTDDLRCGGFDQQGDTDYVDIYQKTVKGKVRRQLSGKKYDKFVNQETQSDSEYDQEVLNANDNGEKSINFIHRSNSISSINEQSSISSPLDDVSESQLEAKVNYATTYPHNNRPVDPVPGHLPPGVYKYPKAQKVFSNVYTPSICLPQTKCRKYTEINNINPTAYYTGYQKQLSPLQYTKNAYGDCKDIFFKYKETFSGHPKQYLKPKNTKVNSIEDNEMESTCSHIYTQDRSKLKRRKICIECLKDKYLTKKQERNCQKNPQYQRVNDYQSERSLLDDMYTSKTTTSKPQSGSERDQQTSTSTILGDTKSTQTVSATKITSGTQTEIQLLSSGTASEAPLFNQRRRGTVSEPIRDKTEQQVKLRTSQIPQPTTPDFRSLYSDLVREKLVKTRISCERQMNKLKKKECV